MLDYAQFPHNLLLQLILFAISANEFIFFLFLQKRLHMPMLHKLQKILLKKALIKAKVIKGDGNLDEYKYIDAIFRSISVCKLICLECERFFEEPAEHIELEYGSFPDKHILHFLIDGIRLLMSFDGDSKKWTVTRVFLGSFEGYEEIIAKHSLPYLFKYPNPEYGDFLIEGIPSTKDIFVFQLADEKIKELEYEYEFFY